MANIVDNILDNKVGLGKSQYLSFLFLGLIDLNDGIQAVLNSLTTPMIELEWNLTKDQSGSFVSAFFIGAGLGAIISGIFSDQYGRKLSIILGSIAQLISSILFLFVESYIWMLIAKFLYGFSFGFTIAQTSIYMTETTPNEFRGKTLLLLNFCVSIGKIFAVLIGWALMEDFKHGNWRLMILLGCLPNILVLIGTLIFLRQTPRYLIATSQFSQAYEILEETAIKNSRYKKQSQDTEPFLTQEEKQKIVDYSKQIYEGEQKAQIKSLFNRYYLRTTICLSLIWFCVNFMYYGQLLALPYIFGKHEKTIGQYLLTVAGQIPAIVVTILIIDRQGFGRKHSIIYASFCCVLFHLLFGFFPITLLSFISRFFMKVIFQMLYPCSNQCYNTLNRSLGIGMNMAVGRLGGVVMPFAVMGVVEKNPKIVSLEFALVSLIGGIMAILLPRQPLGMPLDEKEREQQIHPNNEIETI